jgi:hypothetical protein
MNKKIAADDLVFETGVAAGFAGGAVGGLVFGEGGEKYGGIDRKPWHDCGRVGHGR